MEKKEKTTTSLMENNLYRKYTSEIRPRLKEELGLANIMSVPRIVKVNINVGSREIQSNEGVLNAIMSDLATISGQKPVATKAKKAIAGFKVREGFLVGVRVTLRSKKMYDFLERLINVTLPRLRDFKGLKLTGFDGHGNYNFGLREQVVFPEIRYDEVKNVYGMNITIVTSAEDDTSARKLLEQLGFPFEKE